MFKIIAIITNWYFKRLAIATLDLQHNGAYSKQEKQKKIVNL